MSISLIFPRKSRPDGEGKRARQRNKSAALFTHFLTQKYTPLSTYATENTVHTAYSVSGGTTKKQTL